MLERTSPFINLPRARNIFGIGRNYAAHAQELGNPIPEGEPVLFLKAASSLRGINALKPYNYPKGLHFEAELVLAIADSVPRGTVGDWGLVAALGLGLDLTLRDKQEELKKKQLPWALAKSFSGASVVSPLLPRSAFEDLEDLSFQFSLNGTVKQRGQTKQMIYSVPYLLGFILKNHELEAGDLIFTGTPQGVGPISEGQSISLSWLGKDGQVRTTFEGIL